MLFFGRRLPAVWRLWFSIRHLMEERAVDQQLANHRRVGVSRLRPLVKGSRHPAMLARLRTLGKTMRERRAFFERPQRHPQRPIDRVGLSRQHALGGIHVTDPAAEPDDATLVHLPHRAMALGQVKIATPFPWAVAFVSNADYGRARSGSIAATWGAVDRVAVPVFPLSSIP